MVGTGTPASCTADAFVRAVAQGGVIAFDCGPDPVTITLDRPAKVVNDTGPEIVIDGGGLVTLSGGGRTRLLYMNEGGSWYPTYPQISGHDDTPIEVTRSTIE